LRKGPQGVEARMVDVGGKSVTRREAVARARIRFPAGVLADVLAGQGPKGAVLEVARIAAIQGAKRTSDLIPMCHPLSLDAIDIEFEECQQDMLEVRCRVACSGPTGVEMEAMTGASVAALTIYDMTKGISKGIEISSLELLEKSGGRSGHWRRD
jgi:cyclic pyranopterin phosphate synthase